MSILQSNVVLLYHFRIEPKRIRDILTLEMHKIPWSKKIEQFFKLNYEEKKNQKVNKTQPKVKPTKIQETKALDSMLLQCYWLGWSHTNPWCLNY